MDRSEALRQADVVIERLLVTGDESIVAAARRPDGTIDQALLVTAAMNARQRLADKIMRGEA